jgi:glycosyltransferase involved in cell wall biosynthesis
VISSVRHDGGDTPHIAVIIPYFRASETIERALDSVLAQTLLPTEIVVVDDASGGSETTFLRDLVSGMAATHSEVRITVVDLAENSGPGAARNRGWDACSPQIEVVAFLDADDAWVPHKLARQWTALARNPHLALIGSLATSDSAKRAEPSKVELRRVSLRDQLVRNRFVTSSVTLRSAGVSERFDESMRYSEDNDLWCRILAQGQRGAVLTEPLVVAGKPPNATYGQSSSLVKMQIGQTRAIRKAWSTGDVPRSYLILAATSSVLRFQRRLLLRPWFLLRRLTSRQ